MFDWRFRRTGWASCNRHAGLVSSAIEVASHHPDARPPCSSDLLPPALVLELFADALELDQDFALGAVQVEGPGEEHDERESQGSEDDGVVRHGGAPGLFRSGGGGRGRGCRRLR